MTTAVALKHVIFRELLGLSGVGVGMQLITLDRCHVCGVLLRTLIMPKNSMIITLFLLFFTMPKPLTCALPVVGMRVVEECR